MLFAHDLVHLGQWAIKEGVDIHRLFEDGEFLDSDEIFGLAEASGCTALFLRGCNGDVRPGFAGASRKISVSNATARRRLSVAMDYFRMISTLKYSKLPGDTWKLREERRIRMESLIVEHLPLVGSLAPVVLSEADLGRVLSFFLDGAPSKVWPNPAMRTRNWAMLRLMLATGALPSEIIAITRDDINLRKQTVRLVRGEMGSTPRKRMDRVESFPNCVADSIEAYVFGARRDAAKVSGSPYLFLKSGPISHGEQITLKDVHQAISHVGTHLGVYLLSASDLRCQWLQRLSGWSFDHGLSSSDLDEAVTDSGGWPVMSESIEDVLRIRNSLPDPQESTRTGELRNGVAD